MKDPAVIAGDDELVTSSQSLVYAAPSDITIASVLW
jgi:hypothetical protein